MMTEKESLYLSCIMAAAMPEQERLRIWNEYPETGELGEREFRYFEHFQHIIEKQYKYVK